MKIEIKNRYNGLVIFSHDCENNTIEITVEAALVSRADLSYANFSGADFSGADFTDADFTDADFSGADLSYANFSGADLSYADFSGADLSYANFSGADFTDADLSYANFTRANFTGANFTRADFSGADLSYADFTGANFREANFRGVKIKGGIKLLSARPIITISCMGSRDSFLTAFNTENGIFISTGCKTEIGLEDFIDMVEEEHGGGIYQTQYLNALNFIESNFKIIGKNK